MEQIEVEFDDVCIIGSSIASRFAKTIGIKYYYLARIEKKYIEEYLRKSNNFLKNSTTVLVFLNTNSLANMKKTKDNGKIHVHRTSRLVRPGRIKTYINAYKRIVNSIGDRKLYFFCNMARCMVRICPCVESAYFPLIEQIKLFQRVEEEIGVLCNELPNFQQIYTHKRMVKFVAKHCLGKKKLDMETYMNVYKLILGLDGRNTRHVYPKPDGIHPTRDFDETILLDMVRVTIYCLERD